MHCRRIYDGVKALMQKNINDELQYMGGCQNYGPLLGPLNTRCRSILRTQRGTIILTTPHIPLGGEYLDLLRALETPEAAVEIQPGCEQTQ